MFRAFRHAFLQTFWNTCVFLRERWENQRWLIVGFFGLLLLLLFLVEWLGLFRLPGFGVQPQEALPHKSAVLLEAPRVRAAWQIMEERSYQGPLEALRFFGKWMEDLRWLDSTFQQTKQFTDYAVQAEGWSALRVQRIDELAWLHVWRNEEQAFDADAFLAELSLNRKEAHQYRGITLWEVELASGKSLSFCWTRDLLLLARTARLIEAGISQLDDLNTALTTDAGFNDLKSSRAKDVPLSLYLNLKQLPLGLSVVTPQNFTPSRKLHHFARWMSLDLRLGEDFLIGSGYGLPQLDNPFVKTWLEAPEVGTNKIPDYIPRNTALALSLVWNDGAEAYRQLKAQEATAGNLAQREDFDRHILPWLGDAVCLFITEPTSSNFETDRFSLVEMKDERSAKRLLQQWSKREGAEESFQYQGFDIGQIRAENLLLPFLGASLGHLKEPYYLTVDNFVLFANSRSALERWVEQYSFSKTIGKIPAYQPYAQQWRRNSNAYLWIQTPRSAALFKSLLRKDQQQSMEEAFSSFHSLTPLGIQWSAHQGRLLTTLQLGYETQAEERPSAIAWRYSLKAEAAGPPQVLRNSRTGQLELWVQDVEHRLYCLNRSGQLRWERAFTQPILSDIQEMDFHGDGSLQYLFNTKEKIYLLNAEGEDAEETYPRKLSPAASNGVRVIDYGQGPHIFVGSTDSRVYGFEKYGKPLEGWGPLDGVEQIRFPVQYFEWKGKDYLLLLSKSGTLYMMDRNGRLRHRVPLRAALKQNVEVDVAAERIVACAPNGQFKVANFQGKQFSLKAVEGMTKDLRFAFADILGDERKDYLRASGTELALHHYDSTNRFQEVFHRSFDFPLDAVFPIQLQEQEKAYIGCYSKKRQSIYLLDSTGQNLPGFPLVGTSPFVVCDWFDLNENTLLVANRKDIYAYKLR